MEVRDVPPVQVMAESTRKKLFFDEKLRPRITADRKGRKRYPGTFNLDSVVKCPDQAFMDLIDRCFDWDPKTRITPDEAMAHEWIQDGANQNVPPVSASNKPNTAQPTQRMIQRTKNSLRELSANYKIPRKEQPVQAPHTVKGVSDRKFQF